MAESPLLAWRQRDDDELLYDAEETIAPIQAALAAEGAARLAYAAVRPDLAAMAVLKAAQQARIRLPEPGDAA